MNAFPQSIVYLFHADGADDLFGRAVGSAGDVNKDGVPDLIVGAQLNDDNGADCGSARVFSGKDGSVLYTFYGDHFSAFLGFSVNGAGDVNGDGYAEVLGGAFGDDTNGGNAGMARVYSGLDGSALYTFYGDTGLDAFGVSVAGAGDIDQDGFPDLVVGANFADPGAVELGLVRLFSGRTGAVLATITGENSVDIFGISVSEAGDVNADGYTDLVVGATGTDNFGSGSGSAYIFSGEWIAATARGDTPASARQLYVFHGAVPSDQFGFSVGKAGDLNSDGFADVIIGARGLSSATPGYAKVISGKDGTVLFQFNGSNPGTSFGSSVASAGDIDGDGVNDLIVGEQISNENGTGSGSIHLFSGKSGAALYTIHGEAAGDRFGRTVSTAGDLDGDGLAEIIVGADQFGRVTGTRAGKAYVFTFDTDKDGVPDNRDPLPTQPGVPAAFIEVLISETAIAISSLDLALFAGPTPGASAGRQNALVNRAETAADAIAASDIATAVGALNSLLDRIDSQPSPDDWIAGSPAKTQLAKEVRLILSLITLL